MTAMDEFDRYRAEMNEKLLGSGHLGIKRFFALDTQAYEDGALETFRESNRHGISTVYELPLTYWRVTHQILSEERELRPAWRNASCASQNSGSGK